MPTVIEYLLDDQLHVGALVEPEPRVSRLVVSDERGRTSRVPVDKVLFRHEVESVDELLRCLAVAQAEVDVALLWATVQGDEAPARDAAALARLYFDEASDLHRSAVYRALVADRLHFRRRGRTFEPRSPAELARLREQRRAVQRVADEVERLRSALRKRAVDDALERRLHRYLRGAADRELQRALEALSGNPAQLAFELLLDTGRLPATADLEVLQADLRAEHPGAAVAHAEALGAVPVEGPHQRAAFSIDDPDTREVDDALSVVREAELLRVDVDIADVAALVGVGDPVDREAQRRASTVYLPTGTIYMLPEAMGCGRGSLQAGERRSALRTSVWLDEEGAVRRYEFGRVAVEVQRRLDYETADALLSSADDAIPAGDLPVVEELRLLAKLAGQLAVRRAARGALSWRRPEWKIRVAPDGQTVSVRRIDPESPSRAIVAELMILANGLAARHAATLGVPIIYRVQPAPVDHPPKARPGDARVRVPPAALSLRPAPHWGLGLEAYTQVSSPLRRYADLVVQRQLSAALAGEPLAYTADALLAVLATAEATERELKRLESAVTARWALEYVARLEQRAGLDGAVVGDAPGGSRVVLGCCGAQGILVDERTRAVGEPVVVDVEVVRPRQGVLRLRESR